MLFWLEHHQANLPPACRPRGLFEGARAEVQPFQGGPPVDGGQACNRHARQPSMGIGGTGRIHRPPVTIARRPWRKRAFEGLSSRLGWPTQSPARLDPSSKVSCKVASTGFCLRPWICGPSCWTHLWTEAVVSWSALRKQEPCWATTQC